VQEGRTQSFFHKPLWKFDPEKESSKERIGCCSSACSSVLRASDLPDCALNSICKNADSLTAIVENRGDFKVQNGRSTQTLFHKLLKKTTLERSFERDKRLLLECALLRLASDLMRTAPRTPSAKKTIPVLRL
jgi:hypothetical protein